MIVRFRFRVALTNEMSDARNALDAAKAKQESLNARFNGLLATISNAESELKQAKEESNGVQALSWESALRLPRSYACLCISE